MTTEYIEKFFCSLAVLQKLNREQGANHPHPSNEMLSAFIQLFWAADCAEKEIRSLTSGSPSRTGADRLSAWYAKHCNGDWEHSDGVKIETLDNPGWLAKVDIASTPILWPYEATGKEGELEWDVDKKSGQLVVAQLDESGLDAMLGKIADLLEAAPVDPSNKHLPSWKEA